MRPRTLDASTDELSSQLFPSWPPSPIRESSTRSGLRRPASTRPQASRFDSELPVRDAGCPHTEETPILETPDDHGTEPQNDGVCEELARAREEIAQLHEALCSRTVIGQATGLLMATLRLSPDEAFAELTKMSSYSNRKVRDVAAKVVAASATAGPGRRTRPTALPSTLLTPSGPASDQARGRSPGRRSHVRSGEDHPA
jgi:hypothetical protein